MRGRSRNRVPPLWILQHSGTMHHASTASAMPTVTCGVTSGVGLPRGRHVPHTIWDGSELGPGGAPRTSLQPCPASMQLSHAMTPPHQPCSDQRMPVRVGHFNRYSPANPPTHPPGQIVCNCGADLAVSIHMLTLTNTCERYDAHSITCFRSIP